MSDIRELISGLPAARNKLAVWREIEEVLRSDGSTGAYMAADGLLRRADLSGVPFKSLRIFFLRSSTLEQLIPVLRTQTLMAGIRAEIEIGGFSQYQQEVLNPASPLYQHNPNVVAVAVRLVDIAPSLVRDFSALSAEDVKNAVSQVVETLRSLISEIRSRSGATILVHNFEVPTVPAYGIHDYQRIGGQEDTIRDLNRALSEVCRSISGAYIVNYDGLTSRWGKAGWVDPRMLYMARAAVNPHFLPALAAEYLRYLTHLAGLTRKCLVLDLDNTLWGGIVGEDGLSGIKLGSEYPGSAFVEFQRSILNLSRRGVILALCSKNNEEDAFQVLDSHPDMILRRDHLASCRINWRDKASNLREIAEELNIGLDSLVFLDDNPVEIAQVREEVPEVLAYRLPSQPELYPSFLESLPVFDTLTLTDEDRQRGHEYRQQVLRRSLETSAASLEEFYRKLEMRAVISMASDMTIPRIAQLTQKTNQFNLTTRRYTEQEIRAHIADGTWQVYTLELDDRFGRNGLVAVGILRPTGRELWIDTLLMSCRVMNRTAEQTFVHFLAVQAAKMGYTRLMGEFLPTPKNKVVADLYPSLTFTSVEEGDGRKVWALPLPSASLLPSPYIEVAS